MPGIIVPPALSGPSLNANQTWTGAEVFSGQRLQIGNTVFLGQPGAGDDAPRIQAELVAGQRVVLSSGQWNLGTPIIVNADNVELLGSGFGTVLQVNAGWSSANPLIWYQAPVSAFRRGCRLADFSINGQNVAALTNVIQLDSVRHADVDHIEIHNCPGTNLFLNGSAGFYGAYNTVRACTFRDCYSGTGLSFVNSEWCTVEACQFILFNLGGSMAIHLLGGLNCNISACQFDAVDTGVFLDFCNYSNITGCQFDEGNTQFIKLKAAQVNTICGNTFNQRTGTGTNIITVDLFGANQQNVVTGNAAQSGTGWTYFVHEVNTGSGNGGAGNTYANNDYGGTKMALTTGIAISGKTELNVQTDFGAKGNTKQVNDGAMTSGSAVLTCSTSAPFTQADAGKLITVSHAVSTLGRLSTTIASVTDAQHATMAVPATATGSGLTIAHDLGTQTDGVTTNNSAAISSATGNFNASEVGKQVTVTNAFALALNTTILSVQSATQCTLAANATRTLSGEQVIWGTDDSAAFRLALAQAQTNALARNQPTTVHAPNGWYFCKGFTGGGSGQQLYGSTVLKGDGWGSIVRMIGDANSNADLFAVNPWSGGSADPTQNEKGITIRDLHLQGSVVEDGFVQWRYLLSLNAASDVLIEDVKFSNFQGDAIYLGSGESGANLERHNQRIKIKNCTFDGINRDNRQGVTLIDGDDVIIEGCSFVNCTRDTMPGAIDFEPNANVFSIIRGIRIDECDFVFCGGNAGHVGMSMGLPQSSMTNPIQGITITNCEFRAGVSSQLGMFFAQTQYPTESTPRHDFEIAHCHFYDLGYLMELDGIKGARVHHNTFTNCGNSLFMGYALKSLDISFNDNVLKQCAVGLGTIIEVANCDRFEVDHNVFDNCGASDLSGGIILGLKNGGGLNQPTSIVATPSTTGGTLGAATRSYRLTSYGDGDKETLPTTAVTAVTTGSTASVTVTWVADAASTGTKVYGRAGGSELLMATLAAGIGTWTDTGAITPSGALPVTNTSTHGSSNGIAFTNNVVRQGGSNRTTKIALTTAGHVTVQNSLDYWNNSIPTGTPAAAISPFQDATNIYTVSVASLTVDVSTVPNRGVVTINTSATANTTLTVSNGWVGQIVTFDWVITSTSQAYVTAANMKFAGAAAWSHSATAGRHDTATFRYDGTNWQEISRSINVG